MTISEEPAATNRSRLKRGFFAVLVLIGMVVLHRWWLPLVAYPLAICDPRPQITGRNGDLADCLLLTRACETTLPAFDFARDFATVDPSKRVLILAGQADRAERIGSEPEFAETVAQRLQDMGVLKEQLIIVGSRTELTTEDSIGFAKRWLIENPSQKLLIPAPRFGGGLFCAVAKTKLSQHERERISIIGLPHQGVDETTWWKNSVGLKAIILEYLGLLHYLCCGEPRPEPHWDPGEYEKQLSNSVLSTSSVEPKLSEVGP